MTFVKRISNAETEKAIKTDFAEYMQWKNIDMSSFHIGSIYPHGEDHCEVVFYNQNSIAVAYAELASDLSVTHADEIDTGEHAL